MKIARILINIALPIFLIMLFASILTTKPYLTLSKGLYESHEEIDYDHDYAIERIMGYLNYQYDDLEFGVDENDDTTIMRQTEIDHMVDVKNLYTSLRVFSLICLIIAVSMSYLLYKKDKKELYNAYSTIYVFPILFIVIVGGYMAVDFNGAFKIFHELFFTNDDWILYHDDVLILLLPENFWMVSGVIILFGFSLSIGLIYFLNKKFLKSAE